MTTRPTISMFRLAGAAVALCGLSQAAVASAVMPSFATVPTGWTTDRYDPASFSNVGTYQGRNNVLGIGINSTTDSVNRPGGQQGSFYNTQGKQHTISGGAGSVLAADLYIDSAWRSGTSGYVRTDMWAVGSDATAVADYGIIGFTNYGGAARLRVFDGNIAGGWVDLTDPITFDAWTSFSIELTGNSLRYSVNGAQVYEDSTIGTDRLSAVIMQAYNFAEPSLNISSNPAYVANWSNTQDGTVPEPGSMALAAIALLGLGAARRKQRQG